MLTARAVEMLKFRAEKLHQAPVPAGRALPRGLAGEGADRDGRLLTEPAAWAFGQAEVPSPAPRCCSARCNTPPPWLHRGCARKEMHLAGRGVAASGPLATRLGLSGVPVAAEDHCAAHVFELLKTTGTRVHLCRISSAAGVELVRRAKADGPSRSRPTSASTRCTSPTWDYRLLLTAAPACRPAAPAARRDALSAALADGTIDVLVSDHNPVDEDAKTLPFAEAEPGATGLELLLSLRSVVAGPGRAAGAARLASHHCWPARAGTALGTLPPAWASWSRRRRG